MPCMGQGQALRLPRVGQGQALPLQRLPSGEADFPSALRAAGVTKSPWLRCEAPFRGFRIAHQGFAI